MSPFLVTCNQMYFFFHPTCGCRSSSSFLSTVSVTGHTVGVIRCSSIPCQGVTHKGILSSLLMVPGPGCAVLPLSAELTAGAPASHIFCSFLILTVFSVNIYTGAWKIFTLTRTNEKSVLCSKFPYPQLKWLWL